MNFKNKPVRSEKHRRFLAGLVCAVSEKGDCQAAHIRHGFYGMGTKPSDSLCIPLNWEEHARQHRTTESYFFREFGGVEKAKELAQLLWENTGNEDECLAILSRFRQGDL